MSVVSPIRAECRGIIAPILAVMQGASRKEIRKALRAAWTEVRRGHRYNVWRDEVRIAMREKKRKRNRPKPEAEIIPSMREWARNRGMTEIFAVYDVDDVADKNDPDIFKWNDADTTVPSKKGKRGHSRRPPAKRKAL